MGLLLMIGAASAAQRTADVWWFDTDTGAVSRWQVNADGSVSGLADLDRACTEASGCPSTTRPLGPADLDGDGFADLWWLDPETGIVSVWTINSDGTVVASTLLDRICSRGSGCATRWSPVGLGDFDADGTPDLLWFDADAGFVEAWLVRSDGTVTGTKRLGRTCSAQSGCSARWRPMGVADVDGDTLPDVLWFDPEAGVVSAWRVDAQGAVSGRLNLSWTCAASTGCSQTWDPVALADFDGDLRTDVLWFDRTSGVLAAWRVGPGGIVAGRLNLAWICSAQTGCSDHWTPIGATNAAR